MYEVIIVGAGFAGSVIARELALKGKKVLILEKRAQIGGNMYEEIGKNGIPFHKYGPHIFHTNDENVFEYLKKFTKWFPYEHRVIGKINDKLVPIPFNFKSLEMLFPKEKADSIKEKLLQKYEPESKVSILDLINDNDELIKEFGNFVYENVFANYTAKQWEIPVEQIDKSVINRVPVVIGYDDRYFKDSIQYMPKNGYNEIFKNILDLENITIKLNQDANKLLKLDVNEKKVYFEGKEFNGIVVYTGPIDDAFSNEFGKLPYRSLRLDFEELNINKYQPSSVVNYPNEEKFTRISEFKYFYPENNEIFNAESTTILKEYPAKYDGNNTPYYCIINEENNSMYNKYKDLSKGFKNLYFCGRLAEYKYYNMDAAVKRALEVSQEILKVNESR